MPLDRFLLGGRDRDVFGDLLLEIADRLAEERISSVGRLATIRLPGRSSFSSARSEPPTCSKATRMAALSKALTTARRKRNERIRLSS